MDYIQQYPIPFHILRYVKYPEQLKISARARIILTDLSVSIQGMGLIQIPAAITGRLLS